MISGTTSSCYSLPIHGGGGGGGGIHEVQHLPETNSSSFLFNLSVLKDKVDQIQSFASIWMSPESTQSAMALPTMATLIQEIIVTASSMMFSCQQMAIGSPEAFDLNNHSSKMAAEIVNAGSRAGVVRGFLSDQVDDEWCRNHQNQYSNSNEELGRRIDGGCRPETTEKREIIDRENNYDIVELDAADLLAKYTHYCQICGKGFKRDANLRMHMRAHGDEYKSSAALSNPLKNNPDYGGESTAAAKLPRKYSCPQEGCRWNKNHPKFQPLKSMICVKNHFKRSHCPKMYVCKRCNRKQFSVLSDLRTHEKHCGDLKWQCSCGTTFSRKDKLMGHLALFVGHSPAVNSTAAAARSQNSAQLGES